MKSSYVKLIASLILFGSNGIIAAHITLPSDAIVLLRTLIGSALMVCVLIAARRLPACLPKGADLVYLAASGAAMGASWIFLYEAYRLVGVGISSLAYYCAPIMVMILSPFLFKERLTFSNVVGFCTVLVGAVLVNAQTLDGGGSAWGMFCGWMSAIMHAAMVIFSKKADRVDGVASSALQLVTSFFLVLLFMAWKGDLGFRIAPDEWGWILTLGLINTGLGCYLYFSSFGGVSAQTVAVLGYLEPLSAVILAAALLHESLAPIQVVGGALILGGALFSESFARARLKSRPSITRAAPALRKPPRQG
ncbi:MAG: hypothetical protein PEGG_01483 [Paraeggerthella hongkongensis]|uniref:DMT family transporter n=1 Tax=unclassified Paraeggerthella TaxID=2641972 RepID=UPI001CE46376|nr:MULTISPECIES: EamA family transporter [Paraeggerthella]